MVLAFGVSAPIVLGLGLPSRLIVFAVVVALQVTRRSPSGSSRGWAVTLAALPVLAVVTSLLGEVMQHERVAGDVLVVVALAGSFGTRSAPSAIARFGGLLSLPVVMLFVTPVPDGGHGRDLGWYLLVSVLAGLSALCSDRLLGRFAAGPALRAALADFPRLARSGRDSLRRAATDLDTRIAAQTRVAATPLRRVLLEAQLAAVTAPTQLETTLQQLAQTTATTRLDDSRSVTGEEIPARPSRLRPSATTRIAIHAAVALALALAIAQHLYPDRWTWAAVSVLAISGGLRSRGDVLVRGGERLLGALGGTAAGTLLATTASTNHTLAVALILTLIVVGSLLRQATYASYAFCVTSALALLYGIYGQQGTHLLTERLAENGIGAACVILPSYFLLPITTEAVIRRRSADMLAALTDLLATLADTSSAGDRIMEQTRTVDRRRNTLEDALRPLIIHGHALRLLGREPQRAAQLAQQAAAIADAAHPLIHTALSETAAGQQPARALDALRKQVGSLRRDIARSQASPPPR